MSRGLPPSRSVPGLADWMMHRRTRIEDTAGTEESVIHAVMMAEIGIPIAATLRYEVSGREVRPIERHIHSFLESLRCAGLADVSARRPGEVPAARGPLSRARLAGGRAADGTRNARRATRLSGVPRKDVEDSCVSHS
ncbi:hypothetical protein ACFWWC_09645 [Streptomyces sp. NPDC058642]|uniref:hypothetical protein n=1 Tax=Streptomyces sp. NPDC058642 TaxID=3346572 RepID=UPI0036534F1B